MSWILITSEWGGVHARIVSSVSSTDSKAYKTTLQDYIIHYGGDRVKAVDILVSFKHYKLIIQVVALHSLANANDLLLLTSCVYKLRTNALVQNLGHVFFDGHVTILERLRVTFPTNGNRQMPVENFSQNIST